VSEEKKPTDEEIAKAILQQIEYNAGIPYINEWQQVKTIKFTDILDFITRLKGSIEGLTAENKVVHNENDELIAKVERLKENLANEKKWGKIQAKQVKKETARDILSMFDDKKYITKNELKKAIEKRYDVGVDYEN
jgi:cell division protein FtsB